MRTGGPFRAGARRGEANDRGQSLRIALPSLHPHRAIIALTRRQVQSCGREQKAYSESDDDVRNLAEELERGECWINEEAWHSTVRDAVRERDALLRRVTGPLRGSGDCVCERSEASFLRRCVRMQGTENRGDDGGGDGVAP